MVKTQRNMNLMWFMCYVVLTTMVFGTLAYRDILNVGETSFILLAVSSLALTLVLSADEESADILTGIITLVMSCAYAANYGLLVEMAIRPWVICLTLGFNLIYAFLFFILGTEPRRKSIILKIKRKPK